VSKKSEVENCQLTKSMFQGGWMYRWMDVKAILRIAYSNRQFLVLKLFNTIFERAFVIQLIKGYTFAVPQT
jgi:hypothetical protein